MFLIKLKEKTFKGMANLRQLLIASNNLSELSPKAFMGLNSLEYLCLDCASYGVLIDEKVIERENIINKHSISKYSYKDDLYPQLIELSKI